MQVAPPELKTNKIPMHLYGLHHRCRVPVPNPWLVRVQELDFPAEGLVRMKEGKEGRK
jgi:hypothetical protein